VELHETQFESESHQIFQTVFVHFLGLEALLEAALAESVVARVQVETGPKVFANVLVHLHACFQVAQFVVAAVPIKYFGGNPFACCQKYQLHVFFILLSEDLVDVGNFCVFYISALTIID